MTDRDDEYQRGWNAAIDYAANWLRRNGNAERDPKIRAAFIEAHNAIRQIAKPLAAARARQGAASALAGTVIVIGA